MKNTTELKIVMLIFPDVTQLDFTAPFEVFMRMPRTKVCITALSHDTITSDRGLKFIPDCHIEDAPQADILFVPGGPGINDCLTDSAIIDFLQRQAQGAQYISSVCTGSLLLAAAGLLDGYKATSHWNALDLLAKFGVKTAKKRVVIDKNRITGGGVTAGIDMALALAAHLFGKKTAQNIQLQMEYNPHPPFKGGHPKTAPRQVLKQAKKDLSNLHDIRTVLIDNILREKAHKLNDA